jgi:Helix-turn-helix
VFRPTGAAIHEIREDPLNTILVLEDGKEGEWLTIRFIKNRGFIRPEPTPVRSAWQDGQLSLLRQDADNGRIAELRQLLQDEMTQDQVAERLGVSQSYVSANRGEAGSGKRGRKKTATVH